MPRFAPPYATAEQLLSGAAPSVYPGELTHDQYGATYRGDTAGRFLPLGGPVYATAQALRDAPVPAAGEMRTALTLGALVVGDGGYGPWYWDASNTDDDTLGTVLLPTGRVGPGRWVRSFGDSVYPEWFGYTDDLGATLNAIFALFSATGVKVKLRNKMYTCLTQINLDLIASAVPVTLCGAASGARASGPSIPTAGSGIDGSEMAASVIQACLTRHNFNVALYDFHVSAGTDLGVAIGSASTGYSSAGLTLRNVDVYGGTTGFYIQDAYGADIGKLYAVKQSVCGIYLDRCSAVDFGTLTVRECSGPWAMEARMCKAVNFGHLYLESNYQGLLRLDAEGQYPLNIESIYSENNNRNGDCEWGILLGDYTGVGAPRSWKIGTIHANGGSVPFSSGFIGLDRISNLKIENVYDQDNDNFLAFVPGSTLKVLEINNVLLNENADPIPKIDLTNAPTGSVINISSSVFSKESIIEPTDNAVDINVLGCAITTTSGKEWPRIDDVYVSTNTVLKLYQTNCVVDTTAGPVQITLPNKPRPVKRYVVVNESNTGNNVTVTSDATIQGSTNSTVAPWTSATYEYNHVRGRWMVVARGAR